ncbi:MAG TPA: DinB family protein [Vicinamibacterales bacterium]|nr:DinB family protein [Vicinamibacterales bacterium]
MSAAHSTRIQTSATAFKTAAESFVSALERLSDESATTQPKDGGWTPAQIGMHLALSNELFAGILTGAVPMAQPAAADFSEDAQVFSRVPNKITTFPTLVPPAGVQRAEAIERLRRANQQVLSAIQSLPEDRAVGHCVQLPFGTISLYQFADFTGAHMVRHTAQLQRALASA